jgi:hypothetical protein
MQPVLASVPAGLMQSMSSATAVSSAGLLATRLVGFVSGQPWRGLVAQAAPIPTRDVGVVPPGHLSSDLRPHVSHIGLGRRRDLTLRQDLSLFVDGEKRSLSEVFKVARNSCLLWCPQGLSRSRSQVLHLM